MAIIDGVKQAATATDKAVTKPEAPSVQSDHLQPYRLSGMENSHTVQKPDARVTQIDFTAPVAKPLAGDGHQEHALSIDEIKQKISQMLDHGTDGKAPPAESPAKLDKPLNAEYFSQPVYGSDEKAISQSVEKYGSKLDYKQKQNLDDMISATALGQTDKLKEALGKSTPEARKALAEVMQKEMGLDVDLNEKANGGYDMHMYRQSGLFQMSFSQDKQWAPTTASSGFLNGKAPMNSDPWEMTKDPKSVNQAFDKFSDGASKYRKEIGETR